MRPPGKPGSTTDPHSWETYDVRFPTYDVFWRMSPAINVFRRLSQKVMGGGTPSWVEGPR